MAVFCTQLGFTFVGTMSNMEKRIGNTFSLSLQCELRGLAMPATQGRLIPAMASGGVSVKNFRKGVEETVQEMSVDWHWTMAPDSHIHPSKHMLSQCALQPPAGAGTH